MGFNSGFKGLKRQTGLLLTKLDYCLQNWTTAYKTGLLLTKPLCSSASKSVKVGIHVTLRRPVTPYRDSVDGIHDHVTSKVGYAVTLRAC